MAIKKLNGVLDKTPEYIIGECNNVTTNTEEKVKVSSTGIDFVVEGIIAEDITVLTASLKK